MGWNGAAATEAAMTGRGTAVRARVLAINDTGEVQTVDVETHEGVVRTGIEVLSIYGHPSKPPAIGAVTVLLAIADDQGDYVALPLSLPLGRFGNQADGEVGVSDNAGNRVVIRTGGLVEALAAALIHLTSPQVQIDARGGTVINGNLTVNGDVAVNNLRVNGDLHATGAITAAGNITAHSG